MGTSVRPATANNGKRGATAPGSSASPFEALTTQQAIAAIKTPEHIATTEKFIAGDHWQDGAGWIGPKPPAEHRYYETVLGLIRDSFVSKNVIAEIVERHMTGVAGREPSWTLVPRRSDLKAKPMTDAERKGAEEATSALVEWWDARRIHSLIQEVTERAVWAERAPVRLYVPSGMMSNVAAGAGTVKATTLKGALAKLYADALDHKQATVATDPDTKEEIGIYRVSAGADPFGRNTSGGREVVYVTHRVNVDPSADPGAPGYKPPMTVIRKLGEEGSVGEVDLGGRITMHELRRRGLITIQVQQAQRAINLSATMGPRVITTSGFLSRIITNAQLRGKEVVNQVTGAKEFVPEPPEFGAGITTFLEGLTVDGNARTGGEAKLTPGVHTIPPTPITPIIEAKRAHYEDALEEADQVHVLINGDATPSGKSREEARADYVMSLNMTAPAVIGFIRWLLETALAYGEAILGKPGQWTNLYRVEARLRMSTGKPSAAERAQNASDVKSNLLARESAMEANDVADPEAEIARMAGDPISEYAEAEALGKAIAALVDGGATFEGACRFLELDEDEIANLVGANDETTPAPDPVTDPAGGTLPRDPNKPEPGPVGGSGGNGPPAPAPAPGATGGA